MIRVCRSRVIFFISACFYSSIVHHHDIGKLNPAVVVVIERCNRFICNDPVQVVKEEDDIVEILPAVALRSSYIPSLSGSVGRSSLPGQCQRTLH